MKTPRFQEALGHGPSDKRIDILRGIGRSGSISQAARDAGVSYKAAWQAIDTLTNLAGVVLVDKAVGGSGGGGASLTLQGRQLLHLARSLDDARARVQQQWQASSGAGLGLAATPLALRTSMRNQLPATVLAIDTVGPVSRIRLDLGAEQSISARITRESVELLGLVAGMRTVALFKATAVRIRRAKAADARAATGPRKNLLAGKATGVQRGGDGDEVAMALAAGGQIVGFALAGTDVRVRHRVTAEVDESAVVVALAA